MSVTSFLGVRLEIVLIWLCSNPPGGFDMEPENLSLRNTGRERVLLEQVEVRASTGLD